MRPGHVEKLPTFKAEYPAATAVALQIDVGVYLAVNDRRRAFRHGGSGLLPSRFVALKTEVG